MTSPLSKWQIGEGDRFWFWWIGPRENLPSLASRKISAFVRADHWTRQRESFANKPQFVNSLSLFWCSYGITRREEFVSQLGHSWIEWVHSFSSWLVHWVDLTQQLFRCFKARKITQLLWGVMKIPQPFFHWSRVQLQLAWKLGVAPKTLSLALSLNQEIWYSGTVGERATGSITFYSMPMCSLNLLSAWPSVTKSLDFFSFSIHFCF